MSRGVHISSSQYPSVEVGSSLEDRRNAASVGDCRSTPNWRNEGFFFVDSRGVFNMHIIVVASTCLTEIRTY